MLPVELSLDAPISARYHRESVEQIIQCVEEGVYCVLLGPRLCGKTLLLRFIEQNLAKILGWTCIYIDLLQMRAATQQAFFSDLTHLTAQLLAEAAGSAPPLPEEGIGSSAVFRAYLSDCAQALRRQIVLIVDPLEALPADLVQALLTSLRAAYMDQQTFEHQVAVVVSGALSLATTAVGESSPFRGIARRVFVGDLPKSSSEDLILELLCERDINVTRAALEKLLQATSGDVYLIRKISQRCAELVQTRAASLLRARDVNQVINRFLRTEVFEYAPLIEAIRLIEQDPDLLQCFLLLLKQDIVPRSALPLPLSPDLDPLFLTGMVERVEQDAYRVQNLIYRQFLSQHFSPERVGYVLTMTGSWDSALDYLEASLLRGNRRSRADLLPATISSMYASQDLPQAVHFLRRGLSAAFSVGESQVWLSPPNENILRLIGRGEPASNGDFWSNLQIAASADRLEARAFRQRVPLRGLEAEGQIVRAIPLMVPGRQPIGVVTIFDDLVVDLYPEQRERELQLVGFLNQAARALQTVNLRREELVFAGRVQSSLLPELPAGLPGWQIAAAWKPARETSGDFYDFVPLPDGRLGLVIADVVDKGMGAALLMALTRTLIRTYATKYPDRPEELLRETNQRLLADLHSGPFVTLFYGILDQETGRLVYSNAGHPPPYLFDPDTLTSAALHTVGMPVGIGNDGAWQPASVQLSPGAVLLLYTDGVIEAAAPSGELFGFGRMISAVQAQLGQSAKAIQDSLMSAVFAFSGPAAQADDISLMVITRDL